jgi:hypothetical protein
MKKIVLLVMVLAVVVGFAFELAKPAKERRITTYVVPAITDAKILPTTRVSAKYVSDQISISACRGEYEPASFVVHANRNIVSLEVAASNLIGSSASISSDNIDVRVVKCWYQAGDEDVSKTGKFLTPELLLKDDSLVITDNGENYLKLTTGEYVCISDNTTLSTRLEDFPVADSPTLLPVDIPGGTNKQFWVTVHVPDDAPSGVYEGTITLATPGGVFRQIDIELEVLSFGLLSPYLTYSMDYLGVLRDRGSISHYEKNSEQYRAELADLAAHGEMNPWLSQPVYFSSPESVQDFADALTMRAEAGMSNVDLYYAVPIEYLGYDPDNPTDPAALAALKEKVQALIDFTRPYGVEQLYIMGIDEAAGERLTDQTEAWKVVQSTGAKMWATGYRAGAGAVDGEDSFSMVGNLLDVFVCAREPDADEAGRWHDAGHGIWCYANPQAGVELPETYRRNYGLLLWQSGYDGATTCAYQWQTGYIWNDFSMECLRGHVFAYPTMNGVIDTIEWEAWREAIDDVRYLTTLINTVDQARANGESVTEVETWLAALESSKLTDKNLDSVRSEMIAHIASLSATN